MGACQGEGNDRIVLRRADVVDGAIKLLDAEGLDGLTTRKLGAALNVQSPALYRHFPSKEALLDAMAEKLLEGVGAPVPPGPWDEQLTILGHRFRAALLAHRDGARVVAGTYVAAPNTRAVGTAVISVLCGAGIPAERAGWIAFAGQYYILGHTIEEQALQQLAKRDVDWQAREAEVGHDDPLYAQAFDSVVAADPAERFAYGMELFIDGIRKQLPATGEPVRSPGHTPDE
jgi:TetR/AcrR family transcriptional regulator, tetracycline repressor protein